MGRRVQSTRKKKDCMRKKKKRAHLKKVYILRDDEGKHAQTARKSNDTPAQFRKDAMLAGTLSGDLTSRDMYVDWVFRHAGKRTCARLAVADEYVSRMRRLEIGLLGRLVAWSPGLNAACRLVLSWRPLGVGIQKPRGDLPLLNCYCTLE